MKKTTQSIRELQRTIIPFFFALLITSCASYKAIAPESIAPGNVIRVTMRNGEKIDYLKVTAADSEKIIGILDYRTSSGQSGKLSNKVVILPNIQSIEKRKIPAGKTTVLVVILVTSPAWLWAISVSSI